MTLECRAMETIMKRGYLVGMILSGFLTGSAYARDSGSISLVTSGADEQSARICKTVLVSKDQLLVIDHCLNNNPNLLLKINRKEIQRHVKAVSTKNHISLVKLDQPIMELLPTHVAIGNPIQELTQDELIRICRRDQTYGSIDRNLGGSPGYDETGSISSLLYSADFQRPDDNQEKHLNYACIDEETVKLINP